jgi:hypothetical protein
MLAPRTTPRKSVGISLLFELSFIPTPRGYMPSARQALLLACVVVAALPSGAPVAFAQAGSIGGSVGKTDKSVSGGGNTSEQQARPASRQPPTPRATASLSGRWKWDAGCPDKHYFGDFQLTEHPGGQLTGEFIRDSGAVQGGQITGSVTGKEISFVRNNGSTTISYRAVVVSQSKMEGSLSRILTCTFTASKR